MTRRDMNMHQPNTPPVREALVELDRMKALKVALDSSFMSNMAVGLLLAIVLASMFSWVPVLVWLCGLVVLQRYRRWGRKLRFWARPAGLSKAKDSAQLAARRFEVDSLLLAAYWGTTGLWFFDSERQAVQFAVAHALGGVSLVSLGVHAYHPRVTRWFLIIVNLPFIVRCIAQLDLHYAYVGLGMLLMSTYLVVFGKHLSKVVQQAIELRYENTDLVAELKKQTLQLQSANEAKSRFLAAASHDLRQPVHAVGLLAAAMQSRNIYPSQQDLVRKLQSGLQLFSDVVDEILDVARLDADAVPLNLQSVPLLPLLERIDAAFYELAAAKGLSLVIRLPRGEQPCVWSDSALLWRVLSNLVSNAVRYTHQGTVLIAVRPGHLPPSGADATANRGWRIEVRDSGPGIAPEHQTVVFDEFYQIANLQRDSHQGLGLGLAVVRRMARLLDAHLTLRSRLGAGSVFSFTVRVASAPTTEQLESSWQLPTPPAVSLDQLTVLVIDDDENARSAMESLLLGWQVRVQVASGPEHARALIRAGFTPNLLITDHWLGDGHNALSAAYSVRDTLLACGHPAPEVAVFTGDISLDTREKIQAQGWYIATKPVRPQALMEWLCSNARQLPASRV